MSGHVLLVLHEPAVGGASTAVLEPVPLLRARGWRFSAWAPVPSPVAERLAEMDIPVRGAPRPFRYRWSELRQPPGISRRIRAAPGYFANLRTAIRELRPDVVHANTITTLPEALAARHLGLPTVLHVHEMLDRGPRATVAIRVIRHSALVTAAVSEASAAPLRAAGLAVEVVPFGIALESRPPSPADTSPPVVGTLGTVCRRKGSDVFLDAAENLRLAGVELELRMIGPPAPGSEHEWAIRQLQRAASLGVATGATATPSAELASWSIFVLPTRRDPFPLVVLEAMAGGLPIIASAVDGVPEQIGDAGVLIEPGSPEALAGAIAALAGDPHRRSSLGAAARARVARFSPELHVAALERVWRRAMAPADSRIKARNSVAADIGGYQ